MSLLNPEPQATWVVDVDESGTFTVETVFGNGAPGTGSHPCSHRNGVFGLLADAATRLPPPKYILVSITPAAQKAMESLKIPEGIEVPD